MTASNGNVPSACGKRGKETMRTRKKAQNAVELLKGSAAFFFVDALSRGSGTRVDGR